MRRWIGVFVVLFVFIVSAKGYCEYMIPEKVAFVRSLAMVINPQLDNNTAVEIAYAVVSASEDGRFKKWFKGDEPFFLLLGIITQESHFNPLAVSKRGAVGLMQIHLPTWKLSRNSARDIFLNVYYGKEILLYYLNVTKGNIVRALYRYFGAKSRRYASGVLRHSVQYIMMFNDYVRKEKAKEILITMR